MSGKDIEKPKASTSPNGTDKPSTNDVEAVVVRLLQHPTEAVFAAMDNLVDRVHPIAVLHARIAELRRHVDTQMGRKQDLVNELTGWVRSQVEQLRSELADVPGRFDRLERRMRELEDTVHRHGRIMDALRAEDVRGRDDLTDDRHMRHVELEAEWLDLLRGDAFAELVEADARGRAGADDENELLRLEAKATRALGRALTADQGPDEDAVHAWLAALEPREEYRTAADELVRIARGLHEAARETGIEAVHDYDFPVGAVADAQSTKLFVPLSQFGRPVEFVVLPAYRVGERTLRLPYVFTSFATAGG